MLLDRDLSMFQLAPDQLQAAGDRLMQIHSIDVGVIEPGEPAKVLDNCGDSLDPLPRTV